MSLKMISLNIEFDKHLDLIIPFFKRENADVLLLQEVLEKNLELFKEKLEMDYIFVPLCKLKLPLGIKALGIATFSKLKILDKNITYYFGEANKPPIIERTEPEKMNRAILSIKVEKNSQKFTLINTHFTWSPNGNPNLRQRVHLANLLEILSEISEFALVGDFNAPRGREIFDTLAKHYKDNIPKKITTTIDGNLHKFGNLQLVIDGLFTTKGYVAKDVRVVDGISDHCAIVANITKNSN